MERPALSLQQADAPPMAPELAAATLEAELGRRPDEGFAEFSPESLAAASIGQVHQARLHDGRKVAAKSPCPSAVNAMPPHPDQSHQLCCPFSPARPLFP